MSKPWKWTWPREQRFIRRVNAGASWKQIGEEFGISATSAQSKAGRLRAQGAEVFRRDGWQVRSRAGRVAHSRAKELDRLLERIEVSPAVVMDGNGKVIGTMDPVTRQRRPI